MVDYSGVLKAIKNSDLTELELCEKAHVSNTVIQNIRKGKNVTVDSLYKLFIALKADPKDFILFTDKHKKKDE